MPIWKRHIDDMDAPWQSLLKSNMYQQFLEEETRYRKRILDEFSPQATIARQLMEEQNRFRESCLGNTHLYDAVAKQIVEQERLLITQAAGSHCAWNHLDEANATIASLAKQQLAQSAIDSMAATIDETRLKDIARLSSTGLGSGIAEHSAWLETMRMAQATSAAQLFLSRIPEDKFGARLFSDDITRLALGQSLDSMTGAYAELTRSFTPDIVERLPSGIFASSPREVMLEARLAVVTSVKPDADVTLEEAQSDTQNTDRDDLPTIDTRLAKVDAGFVTMLHGARQSISSRNPDRGRHVSTSIRELIGSLLRRLAPDDQIRIWTSSPEHYHDGRPTRRARLAYIARNIDHGQFSGFLCADYEAAIKFFDACSSGTHVPTSPFTDDQLVAMIARAEGLLSFLLTIAAPTP